MIKRAIGLITYLLEYNSLLIYLLLLHHCCCHCHNTIRNNDKINKLYCLLAEMNIELKTVCSFTIIKPPFYKVIILIKIYTIFFLVSQKKNPPTLVRY